MIPAVSPAERAQILGGMKAGAPAAGLPGRARRRAPAPGRQRLEQARARPRRAAAARPGRLPLTLGAPRRDRSRDPCETSSCKTAGSSWPATACSSSIAAACVAALVAYGHRKAARHVEVRLEPVAAAQRCGRRRTRRLPVPLARLHRLPRQRRRRPHLHRRRQGPAAARAEHHAGARLGGRGLPHGGLGPRHPPRRRAGRPAADDHAQRGLQPPHQRRLRRAGGLPAPDAGGRRRRPGANCACRCRACAVRRGPASRTRPRRSTTRCRRRHRCPRPSRPRTAPTSPTPASAAMAPGLSGGRIPGAPPEWPAAANLTPGAGQRACRATPTRSSFVSMMRSGKRPDGSAVSTVMPFGALGQMSDVDLEAPLPAPQGPGAARRRLALNTLTELTMHVLTPTAGALLACIALIACGGGDDSIGPPSTTAARPGHRRADPVEPRRLHRRCAGPPAVAGRAGTRQRRPRCRQRDERRATACSACTCRRARCCASKR